MMRPVYLVWLSLLALADGGALLRLASDVTLHGNLLAHGVSEFLGIPYAQPPVWKWFRSSESSPLQRQPLPVPRSAPALCEMPRLTLTAPADIRPRMCTADGCLVFWVPPPHRFAPRSDQTWLLTEPLPRRLQTTAATMLHTADATPAGTRGGVTWHLDLRIH